MSYNRFQDFVRAARGGTIVKEAAISINNSRSSYALAAASGASELPLDGVAPAIFPGFHMYVKLDLSPKLTTSANNDDRSKNIRLLADLTQGVKRIIDGGFEGATLEAQGPVVHAFIPNEDGNRDDPREAAIEILGFVNARIRPRAGEDFRKVLIAYCHGPSIFVASIDSQGDNSIVSLAPAANAPAKVLWGQTDNVPSGSILEVALDRRFTVYQPERQRDLITNSQRLIKSAELISFSSKLPDISVINSRDLSVPKPHAPDSPTVDEPQKSYSVSFRADMDGFTPQVQLAFESGREAAIRLAERFHEIMTEARQFCVNQKLVQLPWAGDCFNVLISVDDRAAYQGYRQRRILEIGTAFEDHMKKVFPEVKWSYSCAAGDLEGNQACNTLVSRLDLGETTLLLATGLPVERSLQGLVRESPKAGEGIVWRDDVAALDRDLQSVIHPSVGGRNYRDFSLSAVRRVGNETKAASTLMPPPPVYVPSSPLRAASPAIPVVRNHFPLENGQGAANGAEADS